MGRLAVVVLVVGSALFAQTDAERFAEGRIALDQYKHCKAARDALEAVSEKGRSEALWVLYSAKAYECLKDPEKALSLYIKYNELMPEQMPILEKIGDLRYQVRRQQGEKEAEMAREQKLEEDRQDRERKRQSARAELPSVLRTLQAEPLLQTSWTEEGGVVWSIKTAGEPACQLGLTVAWRYPDKYQDPGTRWERVRIFGSTSKVVLDLTNADKVISTKRGGYLFLSFLSSQNDGRSDVVKGSVEKVDKWLVKNPKNPAARTTAPTTRSANGISS